MVGGIFACGLTHAAICPLDIVKCRKQVSFGATKNFAGQPQDVQVPGRWLEGHRCHRGCQRSCIGKFFNPNQSPPGSASPALQGAIVSEFNLTRCFRVGSQLWSATVCKASQSLVSTKCSRMSIRVRLAIRPPSIRPWVSSSHLLALRLLPTFCFAPGKL